MLDAVTIEILWSRITSIVDEAAKVIVRTSFSTLSNEANDFACVLTDAAGQSLAQNTGSIPSFIGTLPATVRHFLGEFGPDSPDGGMQDGDVYITNNPWQGTGHLPDVCIAKPVFRDGRLVAFAAACSHVPDIGGMVRSVEPREVFEEGLHIPLMRFMRNGVADATLIKLLRTNVRTPDQTLGDIWALVGAVELMARRLVATLEEYGQADVSALAAELFARSEAAMRRAIRALPEGTYRFGFDTDGLAEPFRFELALTIRDGAITADYTGSSPQQPRAINCPLTYTNAMTAYAVKCALLPNLPNNEGMFRPDGDRAGGFGAEPDAAGRRRRPHGERALRADAGFRRSVSGRTGAGDGGAGLPALGLDACRAAAGTEFRDGAVLQRRFRGAARQGRRQLPVMAVQHLVDPGRGRRAQQPDLLPLQAVARRLGWRRPVSRRARPGCRDRH
jgi:Hydantoinase B/oxoprolinase